MEAFVLNYGFLGLIELPDLSFSQILELWPIAPDRHEHDALAAVPLRADLIKKCLASPMLPGNLLSQMQRSEGVANLAAEDHRWHPTSPARLALALWLSEL
jgi:hypothetical protein